MKTNQSRILRYGLALFGTVTLALVLWGQESNPAQNHVQLVTDWSHHHLIFSNPSDIQKAIQVRQDPRFWTAVDAPEYTGITGRDRSGIVWRNCDRTFSGRKRKRRNTPRLVGKNGRRGHARPDQLRCEIHFQ